MIDKKEVGDYRGWAIFRCENPMSYIAFKADKNFQGKSQKEIRKKIDSCEDSPPAHKWQDEENYKLPPELVEKFQLRIYELAKEMFGHHNGLVPVNVVVVDRTRFEAMHYLPVPLDENKRMETLVANLQILATQLRAKP